MPRACTRNIPGGNYIDLSVQQDLLKRARVMVRVAVCHYDSGDKRRPGASSREQNKKNASRKEGHDEHEQAGTSSNSDGTHSKDTCGRARQP